METEKHTLEYIPSKGIYLWLDESGKEVFPCNATAVTDLIRYRGEPRNPTPKKQLCLIPECPKPPTR